MENELTNIKNKNTKSFLLRLKRRARAKSHHIQTRNVKQKPAYSDDSSILKRQLPSFTMLSGIDWLAIYNKNEFMIQYPIYRR